MMHYDKINSHTNIILTPSVAPIGSVIWLHGLGADGHDFAPIVPELKLPDQLPLRFIFPHAPVRPVTINNGFVMRAWFDIYSMNIDQHIDHEGISSSIKIVHDLIENEKNLGIPTDKIVLAGFSQGSVIALGTGLNYPEKLAGIIALSGFLPNAEQIVASFSNHHHKTLPVFIGHGNQDMVVPCILGKMTADALIKAGYPVTWKEYPIAHSVCAEELKQIAHWLTQCYTAFV